VFTKLLGRTVSTDYIVIECAGTGQITLGRSLLKLLGVVIDVGKGTLVPTSPPSNVHMFPRGKQGVKKGKRKAHNHVDTSSLDNT
jgi:hypothetical protein